MPVVGYMGSRAGVALLVGLAFQSVSKEPQSADKYSTKENKQSLLEML